MIKTFFVKNIQVLSVLCSICAITIIGTHIAHAQSERTFTVEPINRQEISIGTVSTAQDQQVYASDVLPAKDTYTAGESIDYIFKLYNATPFDVTALKYKVIVADAERGDHAFLYEVKGSLSLQSGESVKISDTIIAPATLRGEKVVIRVVPAISSGITYPYADSRPITIKNALPALEMGSWAVITDTDEAYPFQAGPSLYKSGSPSAASVDVWLRSASKNTDISYNMKVYERGVELGKLMLSTSSALYTVKPFNTRTPDEEGLDLSIPLPVFNYTPGVYEAYIEFVDAQGVLRAPVVVSRYTVQGDIAAIQFVRPSTEQVEKGATFSLISSITGRPTDIFTNPTSTSSMQEVQVKAEVLNEKNQIVAEMNKTILLPEDYYDESVLTAQQSAKAMSVHMTVSKNGVILSEWNNPISASFETEQIAYQEQKQMYMLYGIALAIILLIVCIVLVMISRRKKNGSNNGTHAGNESGMGTGTGSTGIPLAALVFMFIGISAIYAFPQPVSAVPSVNITYPADGTIMLPGQKFTPRASVYYKACVNWGYDVGIQFLHNGAELSPFRIIDSAARSAAKCSGGPRNGQSCTSVRRNSPDCSGSRCLFTDHSIAGPNGEEYSSTVEATAPMTPGNYIVSAIATGNGEEGGADGIEYNSQGFDQNVYTVAALPGCDDCEGGGGSIATSTSGGGGGTATTTCAIGFKQCSTLRSCIPDADTCESPCESPAVSIGVPLSGSASLCKTGFSYVSPSLFGKANTNNWNWSCQKDNQTTVNASCSVSCPVGSYFDITSNSCQTTRTDWCPNIPGNQTNIALYRRDPAGNCIASGAIKYFRFDPNTTNASCPAYWETESIGDTRFECSIDGENVPNQKPEGALPLKSFLGGKNYTLSCDLIDNATNATTSTIEKSARCYRVGQVREN